MLCIFFRPQVRWGTQEQLTPPSQAAKAAVATPRVNVLAKPKPNHVKNEAKLVYIKNESNQL